MSIIPDKFTNALLTRLKILFLLAAVFSFPHLHAQSKLNTDLKSLVDAEFAFIADSKKFGTKKAFYNNLADSAITFGQTIRKGRKIFEGESDTVTWLNWKPVFTDIASSGDFGYNTGPWEFRANRNENPVAFGEFVTVWQKNPDGKWKALIDIGIYHNFPMREEDLSTSSQPLKKNKVKGNDKSLEESEKQFISQLNYSEHISDEARFYRGDKLPVTTKQDVNQFIREQSGLTYTYLNGDTSSSDDLGFVYGTAMQSGDKSMNYFYLRIWKKEDGKHWKIVLDLLTPQ